MTRRTARRVASVSFWGMFPLVTFPRTSASPLAPTVGDLYTGEFRFKGDTYREPLVLLDNPTGDHFIVGVVTTIRAYIQRAPSVRLERLLKKGHRLGRHCGDHFRRALYFWGSGGGSAAD